MPILWITRLFLCFSLKNCFTFWICDEVGSKWILLKLVFLSYLFAFFLSVFLSTNINLLPLSWILRINSLSALFMLALHLFSACVSALLIVLLYFFRKVSLNISCSILDKNLSTLGIFHFVVILLLWLLIIGGFIPSLVSSFLLLVS